MNKRLVPGRPVNTITEIELLGEGYTEAELEQAESFEIASKKNNPMMERLRESIKREGRRLNFKVIK